MALQAYDCKVFALTASAPRDQIGATYADSIVEYISRVTSAETSIFVIDEVIDTVTGGAGIV